MAEKAEAWETRGGKKDDYNSAAIARHAHPARNAIPPNGVIAPRLDVPVSTRA